MSARRLLSLAVALILGASSPRVHAGGPRAVNGAGQPMAWSTTGPVTYHPDQGALGLLNNADARALVAEAFGVWTAGPAAITFTAGAPLPQDVNAVGSPSTNPAHYKNFYRKSGDGRSPVIFDADGSIIDAIFGVGARFDILGVAGLDTPVGVATTITEASIIINGAFFDGIGPPSSPEDLTRTGLMAAMVHEIGHFINLDHTVLNHEMALDGNPGNDIYVPTMFPIAVADEEALASTNPDDELAALNLYPTGAPSSSIAGSVGFGGVPFQGANVVLRKSGDRLMTAYALISGGLYFPCNPGSACDPCTTTCPPNPAEQGEFSADFFAAGQYEICVEPIDTRFSIANGTFVGPLATPPILPGPEECYDLAEAGTQADDPDEFGLVTAGSAGAVDVLLNALPSTDPNEPNGTFGTAASLADLPGGQDTAAGILGPGDLDVFAVPVTAGQRVRIDLDADELGSSLDAVVGFYDGSNALVASSDDAPDPDSSAFSFDPALELVAGFTGTAKVVVSSFPDLNQTGSGGTTTGPYWIRVEVDDDTDGDGVPDTEDICPATAKDDTDRDGLCFGADNCPIRPNPLQVSPRKVSGTLVSGGDVDSYFFVSPDGSRVVYRADQDANEVLELYSAPVGGGAPVKLNPPLVAGGRINQVRISPDGGTVVYSADQEIDEVIELYSVPIDGGGVTKLGTGGVFNAVIAPDGARVVYWNGSLLSVPIGGGASTPLAGPVNFTWQITPDSTKVVYSSNASGRAEIYVVPISGGASTRLNGDLVATGFVYDDFVISPDGTRVVYRAYQDTTDYTELYSVSIAGGVTTKLNGVLPAGFGVSDGPGISPDSTTVVYRAYESTKPELFAVPISGGVSVRLSPPSPAGGVEVFTFSADGSRVLYSGDVIDAGKRDLFSVPLAGGTSVRLNPVLVPGGWAGDVRLAADSRHVVFRATTVAPATARLFSADVGGGTATPLTPSVPGALNVWNYRIPGDGDSVVYVTGDQSAQGTEIYRVSLDGTGTRKLNDNLPSGGAVTIDFAMSSSPGSSTVAYRADQIQDEVQELFVVDAFGGRDADADGILDGCDLCPSVANADQLDVDGNGVGDACAGCAVGTDADADGVCGAADNCPTVVNANQVDFDLDGVGDACDSDDDNDGLADVVETDTGTFVSGSDTGTDPFDPDSDGDGISDGAEVAGGSNPNNPAPTLSKVPFQQGRTIFAGAAGTGPVSVVAADVDGDGDMDALSTGPGSGTVDWHENDGASPPGWTRRTIASETGPRTVVAADVDGDGDVDALAAIEAGDRIVWYQNDGASPPGWTTRTISTAVSVPRWVAAADVDGDGDVDAVSASFADDKIAWYENDGASPPGWTARTISTGADGAVSVFAVDLDDDGDVDALSASQHDDKIAWYENDGASPPGWTARTISAIADGAQSVFAADVDGDGDIDALSASAQDDKIAWYENDGASPPGWTPRTITLAADNPVSVFAADVDGDGDVDALSVSQLDDQVRWYENDGAFPPVWVTRSIGLAGDPVAVFAADLDRDGDVDVLSASQGDGRLAWYENRAIHRNATYPIASDVATGIINPYTLAPADIDRDGDLDIVSCDAIGDKVLWHENDGASPPGWTTRTIATGVDLPEVIATADVDGDGDIDALSASFDDDTVAWYENSGASPPIWTKRVISTSADGAHTVDAADVDGDGDIDVISNSFYDQELDWYENDGASPPGWTARNISPTAAGLKRGLSHADLDGDGDMDLLAALVGPGLIAWYENNGATPPAWTARTVNPGGALGTPGRVAAADIDGDGDVDVASAAYASTPEIVWFENVGGTPPTFSRHSIPTAEIGHFPIFIADLDADGDMDLMSASVLTVKKVAWWENDGASPPGWTEHPIAFPASGSSSVVAGDVDADGDLDVLAGLAGTDRKVVVWDNRGGQFSLSTTSLAPATLGNGATAALLSIQATSNGRAGDSDVELATFEFRITDGTGSVLSSDEANALIERVRVYLDDGSGVFELQKDTLVATVDALTLSPLIVPFATGDPRVGLAPAQSKRFFVVVETTLDGSSRNPNAFRITHLTTSTSKARNASTGALVTLQYASDTATPTVTAVGDVTRPVVTSVFPPDGTVDLAPSTDVVLFFSEPIDPATANPGVTVSAGGAKVAGRVSVSADGRVVAFDPEAALAIGTVFSVRVGAALLDRSGNPAIPFASIFSTTFDVTAGQVEAATIGDDSGGRTLEGGNMDDNSGFAAAALRDVNATTTSNGIDDLIIGAPNADAGGIDAGKATLVFGTPGLQSNSGAVTSLVYRTGRAGDFIGETVARAGDVDRDDVHDVLIGAPRSDQSGTDAGAVYLVFGDPGLDEASPGPLDLDDLAACATPALCGVVFFGETPGDLAGTALSFAGDVNADGFDDIVIGAPGADPNGKSGAGKAYLIYGPLAAGTISLATVGTTTPGLVFNGETAGDRLGTSVSSWEEDGGDGIDDLLLGAPGAATLDDTGAPISGAGYVYAIQGGTMPGKLDDTATPGVIDLSRVASGGGDQVAGMVFLGTVSNGNLGRSITGAVDTNGDGVNDVLMAGNGEAFAIPGDGPKIVIGGTRTGGTSIEAALSRTLGALDALRDLNGVRYAAPDQDPLTIGPAGDLDADGFGDFIIGAELADGPGGIDAGKAYVVLGSPAVSEDERALVDVGVTVGGFVVDGAEAGDNLGASVGGGFDLNADGIDDGLVGAPFADSAPAVPHDAGETYVISPIRPAEVMGLTLQNVGGGATRLEWSVPDLGSTYNVYRGLVSAVRAAGGVKTSGMTQLACGIATDADADLLPDHDDGDPPPVAGGVFVYLVTARNASGEGPIGAATVDRVNDAQCP